MASSGFVKVCQVGELSPGDMMAVEVAGEQVLLANVDGNYHAIEDICSHAYASLSEGDLDGHQVECPLHGSSFDVTTGEPQTPPAEGSVRVYQVRIEGDDVLLAPPQS